MKKLIALEELGQFVLSLYFLFQIQGHISIAILLPAFFIPDVFAVGFLINNRAGTVMYNFSHHKLIAIIIISIGIITKSNIWLQAGLIAYGHSSFDRVVGYGLKYFGNPNHTHLGFVGKEKDKNQPDF